MASAAAAKVSPYSITNANPRKVGLSHKFSIQLPFCSDSPSPRLVAVHSNNPNLDSVKMDKSVCEFGSGPGSAESSHASPSPSAAIDFLTLCNRLKVCPNFVRLHVLVICTSDSSCVWVWVWGWELVDMFLLLSLLVKVSTPVILGENFQFVN